MISTDTFAKLKEKQKADKNAKFPLSDAAFMVACDKAANPANLIDGFAVLDSNLKCMMFYGFSREVTYDDFVNFSKSIKDLKSAKAFGLAPLSLIDHATKVQPTKEFRSKHTN